MKRGFLFLSCVRHPQMIIFLLFVKCGVSVPITHVQTLNLVFKCSRRPRRYHLGEIHSAQTLYTWKRSHIHALPGKLNCVMLRAAVCFVVCLLPSLRGLCRQHDNSSSQVPLLTDPGNRTSPATSWGTRMISRYFCMMRSSLIKRVASQKSQLSNTAFIWR